MTLKRNLILKEEAKRQPTLKPLNKFFFNSNVQCVSHYNSETNKNYSYFILFTFTYTFNYLTIPEIIRKLVYYMLSESHTYKLKQMLAKM